MDERTKLEVIRNIVLNSSYQPAEFVQVAHCVAYLEEKLAALPAPAAEPEQPNVEG